MQKKFNICFILLILLLCIGGCAKKSYLSSADNSTDTNSSYTNKTDSKKSNTTKNSSERLVVQVAGAVNSPGVYELDSDARSEEPFAAPEDIKNISGIKDGVYSKIEDKIKV